MRVLISGGGTGGHIYPAIAIADALKERNKQIEILFVGAKGRMEMAKVPKAGYDIKGLTISGLQRRLTLKNVAFPFKVVKSLFDSRRIIQSFKPDIGVGVGGYASGPSMYVLSKGGVPLILQEQNSFPGITNKILAGSAQHICTAYPDMDNFFPEEKIVFTGNPVRKDILSLGQKKSDGFKHFGLDPAKKTCLIVGGSLGARTLNEAMEQAFSVLESADGIQILWQYGGGYVDSFGSCETTKLSNVKALPFIDRMDMAYAVADVMIARAGALTISELSLAGIPTILVPSPHVAEDHQTKNAMALVSKNSALIVKDNMANQELMDTMFSLIEDKEKQATFKKNLKQFAKPDAANEIADLIINTIQQSE